MAIQKFDESNNLTSSIERYFNTMGISEEQKRKRIKLAKDIELIMILFLMAMEEGNKPVEAIETELTDRYVEALKENDVPIDDYLVKRSVTAVQQIVSTTVAHIYNGVKEAVYILDEKLSYYTSDTRARKIAINEASVVWNHTEYEQNVDKYAYKVWRTMEDERVRVSHVSMDKMIMKADGVFNVNGSLMRYPQDDELGASPEEIINCRCWLEWYALI